MLSSLAQTRELSMDGGGGGGRGVPVTPTIQGSLKYRFSKVSYVFAFNPIYNIQI